MTKLHIAIAVALVVLSLAMRSTEAQTRARCLYRKCSYFGDPHLIPFPSSYAGPQNQYWCQKPGWELFISNSYVSIYVLVGSSPYWIIDYVLTFHGVSPCVIIGSGASPPVCAPGTPVTSVTVSAGSSWHHFHNTECIIVQIEKWSSFYNVHVYQSFPLISSSVGLCRKWNCTKESAWIQPSPIIPIICDTFIKAAQQRAIGNIERNMIEMAQISCINDMQMTLDAKVARTALSLILDHSAESRFGLDDPRLLLAKADALKREAIQEAIKKANNLLRNTTNVSNDHRQCLSPIDENKQ